MNVSKLSDVELNRAMIWLYMDHLKKEYFDKYISGEWSHVDDSGDVLVMELEDLNIAIDFLTDYNLTMPLAKKHMITIRHYENTTETQDFMWGFKSSHEDQLRATCEVLVMIAMEERA
jgi:hypothetical protein